MKKVGKIKYASLIGALATIVILYAVAKIPGISMKHPLPYGRREALPETYLAIYRIATTVGFYWLTPGAIIALLVCGSISDRSWRQILAEFGEFCAHGASMGLIVALFGGYLRLEARQLAEMDSLPLDTMAIGAVFGGLLGTIWMTYRTLFDSHEGHGTRRTWIAAFILYMAMEALFIFHYSPVASIDKSNIIGSVVTNGDPLAIRCPSEDCPNNPDWVLMDNFTNHIPSPFILWAIQSLFYVGAGALGTWKASKATDGSVHHQVK